MANKEHLAILKQGVEVWDAWRREYLDVRLDLSKADLSGADLSKADLIDANLSEVNLIDANLSAANLSAANLSAANLSQASLGQAVIATTNFTGLDLSTVNGLDAVQHYGPSAISTDTLVLSKGKIPEAFLRTRDHHGDRGLAARDCRARGLKVLART